VYRKVGAHKCFCDFFLFVWLVLVRFLFVSWWWWWCRANCGNFESSYMCYHNYLHSIFGLVFFFSGADIVLKSLFVFLFFCLNVCVNEEDNEVAPVVHCF
jgi:hypothetical protein